MKITQKILDAYYLETCTPEESKAVRAWLASEQMSELLPLHPAADEYKEKARLKLFKRPDEHRSYWLAAASVLILLTFWFVLRKPNIQQQTKLITFSTKPGQRATLHLPDSSIVHLNGSSSVTYPEKFIGERRQVSFSGEGFFDIKKNPDQPFVIDGPRSQTRVLGTSFNLRDYTDEAVADLVVVSGKVAYGPTGTSQPILLLPEERATLNAQLHIQKQKVHSADYIVWKDNRLIFNNTELKVIAESLEHYYGIRICIPDSNLKNERFTGNFDDQSLEHVLKVIGFALQFHTRQQETCITLSPN